MNDVRCRNFANSGSFRGRGPGSAPAAASTTYTPAKPRSPRYNSPKASQTDHMDLHASLGPAPSIDLTRWVPIFPLPSAVLFPKAILPLHIFEQRYRIMTADALSGSRLIALALLQPGYEKNYHTLSAAIHPLVCVGRILREERLPDGRYNFLLQGVARGLVAEENRELRYRRAKLQQLSPTSLAPEIERAYRHELRRLLHEGPLAELAEQAGWIDLMRCSDLAFSDLLDVLASVILPDVAEKQEFLAEPDTGRRAKRLCAVLSVLSLAMEERPPAARRPRSWPPALIQN
jgi:uncharacterized protein